MVADVDKWIDIAKECKYLPENEMKVNLKNNNKNRMRPHFTEHNFFN